MPASALAVYLLNPLSERVDVDGEGLLNLEGLLLQTLQSLQVRGARAKVSFELARASAEVVIDRIGLLPVYTRGEKAFCDRKRGGIMRDCKVNREGDGGGKERLCSSM